MNMSSNNFNQQSSSHEINSFRKAVASNNKQSIQKHLSHMKNLSEAELNAALFTCIDNFRIQDQSDQCLFLLLRNKANPNCEISSTYNYIDGQTPLIAACKIAQLSMVKHLIENGARPDLCNSQGRHPLQFVLMSRKENYDVAQYIINVIASVNIEIDKSHALIVAVDKQFARIFKMLVDKGATLVFGNYQTILHIIMKKKFKDSRKKKKFLKQLANRGHLSLMKDKTDKIPIEYETEEQIKLYYNEIFKQKQKPAQKDNHIKLKQKDLLKESSKQKQNKKKLKQEEPSLAVEQQAIDQQQNDEQTLIIVNNEQDKQKIIQVIEEDEDEKKNEQQRQKIKKTTNKILAPIIAMNTKKYVKTIIKVPIEKSFNNEKSQKNNDKQKLKKNNNDKKKKPQQTNLKKNKNMLNGKKIIEFEQQKKEKQQQQPLSRRKQEEVKKKILSKYSSKDEQSKKSSKKETQIKQQHKLQMKYSEESNKNKQFYNLTQGDHKQLQTILKQMINLIQTTNQQLIMKDKSSSLQIQESSCQSDKQSQEYNLQQTLNQEIFQFFIEQKKNNQQNMPSVNSIIKYLENKMKLCIQSHVNHPFSFQIRIYGSQATCMAIDNSDIDIIILTNLIAIDLMNMFQFYRIFEEQQIKDYKFIKNANIPVIKLALSEVFKQFKVDITFMFRQHRGLRCVELMNQFKVAEPLLQPLVFTLKRIIYAHNLSDPYTGGLSSYSMTLMVIALLQMINIEKTKENLGRIFLQFLLFYGFQLEYVCQAIIIQPPYHAQHKVYGYEYFYNIYQLPNTMDLTPKLVIYDPLDPVNNVGRSTYRIQSLKNMFKVIYTRLKLQNLRISDILSPELQELINQTY